MDLVVDEERESRRLSRELALNSTTLEAGVCVHSQHVDTTRPKMLSEALIAEPLCDKGTERDTSKVQAWQSAQSASESSCAQSHSIHPRKRAMMDYPISQVTCPDSTRKRQLSLSTAVPNLGQRNFGLSSNGQASQPERSNDAGSTNEIQSIAPEDGPSHRVFSAKVVKDCHMRFGSRKAVGMSEIKTVGSQSIDSSFAQDVHNINEPYRMPVSRPAFMIRPFIIRETERSHRRVCQ